MIHRNRPSPARRSSAFVALAAAAIWILASGPAAAHGVQGGDAAFMSSAAGAHPFVFAYLGAKHMVTGHDHLLFLVGVVFLLRRLRDVALYATLFSVGHSLTLLAGVLGGVQVDARLVDAVIALSVVYKGFDNLGGFRTLLGLRPDPKLAVLGFGLAHGLGLATKIQTLHLSPRGRLANLLAFNLGVELGQLLALAVIVALLALLRGRTTSTRTSLIVNGGLMAAGLVLMAMQLTAYALKTGLS